MNLNIKNWHDFKLSSLFDMKNGYFNNKPETIKTIHNDKSIPFLGASAENNGITDYCEIESIKLCNKTGKNDNTLEGKIFDGNCITITNDGSVCNAYYQSCSFTSSHSMTICIPNFELNIFRAMFICSIINKERFKWSYGRKLHDIKKAKNIIIKLPIQHNEEGIPLKDENRTYSDEGYIPDWQFMEDYIKSLHHKPITTKVKADNAKDLNADNWEEFYLKDLFLCQMGNGIDASATTNDNPIYNYVSRDSKGNGVVAQVDEYINISKGGKTTIEEPFQAGTMTLALGGSFLGSCFVQKYPYYTAQNVAVLTEKEPLSIATKLFISTLIRNECKYKYLAFGRELNTHYKTDFMIKLPIKRDSNGNPVIDDSHTYSDNGYIPDWQYMEDYINSLPYSDRI